MKGVNCATMEHLNLFLKLTGSKQPLFFFVGALVRSGSVGVELAVVGTSNHRVRASTDGRSTTGDGRGRTDGWRVAAAAEILLVHPPQLRGPSVRLRRKSCVLVMCAYVTQFCIDLYY